MSGSCQLEVKTLKGDTAILDAVDLDETVEAIYDRVRPLETTPDGKWKLMLIVGGAIRTLRWTDRTKQLSEYGAKENQKYRLEVILDMGACHTTRKR